MRLPTISFPLKVTILGTTVGITLIGLLAAYFRRRKKRRPYRDIKPEDLVKQSNHLSHSSMQSGRSPNGDIPSLKFRRSASPSMQKSYSYRSKSNSISSAGASSVASTIVENSCDMTDMSPDQLCELGLEALQLAINHWEEALDKIEGRDNAITLEPAITQLHSQIRHLVDKALRMRDDYEQKLIRQVSSLALDTAMTAITETEAYNEERRRSIDSISDDMESFVSASDMADLSDLDEQKSSFQHLVLYEAGLLELTHGSIPCRTLRTEMLGCASDTEFLAKLFSIRIAFESLLKDEEQHRWFIDMGRDLIGGLLAKAEKDTEDFQTHYDEMIRYCSDPQNISTIADELHGRGVKMVSFYDVVIDFILLDAFDDLENPPSSVTAVVQNRWLSNGFKETALATAVWSVLKAKRRLLKYRNGFIAHFYAISEHVSPVLAWGFLGPDGPLKELCFFFKDQVLGFMQDIFDFQKVRYTSVENLVEDIVRLAKDRQKITSQRLST